MAFAVSSSSWGEAFSSVSSTATMDAASLSAAAKAAMGAMFSAIANVRNTARIRFIVHDSFLLIFVASQEISTTFKQHICDMQFNAVAVALKS